MSNSFKDKLKTANVVRKQGVEIFAIGVGKGFDKNFLNDMVGTDNSFTINNMSELAATFAEVVDKITR